MEAATAQAATSKPNQGQGAIQVNDQNAATVPDCLPTTSVSNFLFLAKDNPQQVFDDCRVDSVRLACLKVLREKYMVTTPAQACWAERYLNALPEGDPCWQPLFLWYLQNSIGRATVISALEYAIQRLFRQRPYEWGKTVPAISTKLNAWRDSNPLGLDFRFFSPDDLYWQVPSMTRLMNALIAPITGGTKGDPKTYGKEEWRNAMAAINQITEARDLLMHPLVQQAWEDHDNGVAGPCIDRDGFRPHACIDHLALLRARRTFLDRLHQQPPDFLELEIQRVSPGASCPCRVECPKEAKAGELIQVVIWVSRQEDLSPLARTFLSRVKVRHHLDGFAHKGEYTRDSGFNGFGGYNLELIPRPGSNRVWIWFESPDINVFEALKHKRAVYVFGT
jgi:hypothetical protein